MKYSELIVQQAEEAAEAALAQAHAELVSARERAELAERELGDGIMPVYVISRALGHEWATSLGSADPLDVAEMSLNDIYAVVDADRQARPVGPAGIAVPAVTPTYFGWEWRHSSANGRLRAWADTSKTGWAMELLIQRPEGPCLKCRLESGATPQVTRGYAPAEGRHYDLLCHILKPLQDELGFDGLLEAVDRIREEATVTL